MNITMIRTKSAVKKLLTIFAAGLLLASCAGNQEKAIGPAANETSTSNAEPAIINQASASTQAAQESAATNTSPVMAAPDPLDEPAINDPVRIVQSCKNEPFVQHEEEARLAINQAWKDTQDGRFGYGFNGTGEYKKWKASHKELFTQTASACRNLTKCARAAGNDAEAQCLTEAKTFAAWQETSSRFTEKTRTLKVGMAPNLCTITPNSGDLSECFDRLANRIDDTCKGEECVAISQCWRSVAYLDEAIRQAESSCNFVHQALENCRSYTAASSRRLKQFNQCQSMQKEANLEILPVL